MQCCSTEVRDRNHRILELRLEKFWTLDKIGKQFGITRERVRQIIVKHMPDRSSGYAIISETKYTTTKCARVACNNQAKILKTSLAAGMRAYCSKKCSFIGVKKGVDSATGLPCCRRCGSTKDVSTGMVRYCRTCNTERCREWRRKPGKREIVNALGRKSYAKFKDKQDARAILNYAVRSGEIKKPEHCSVCSETIIEAHHQDYSKPLEVIWLCRPHHAAFHKKYGTARI